MTNFEILIITLKPMKVVKFYGFSETPEEDASTAADRWLKEHVADSSKERKPLPSNTTRTRGDE